jgi:hypothetical protein
LKILPFLPFLLILVGGDEDSCAETLGDPDGEVEGPVEVDGWDEGPEEGPLLKLGMLDRDGEVEGPVEVDGWDEVPGLLLGEVLIGTTYTLSRINCAGPVWLRERSMQTSSGDLVHRH